MSAGHVDPTIKTNVLSNTIYDAVIDPVVIAAWRNEVANKVDQNYDVSLLKTGGTMTDNIIFPSSKGIKAIDSSSSAVNFVNLDGANKFQVGKNLSNFNITAFTDPTINNNTVWHAGNAGPFYKGAGSPEGVVTSVVGGIYQRTDGGASTTLYVKQSGTGNTGWIAK
jgi:hypothetical protein